MKAKTILFLLLFFSLSIAKPKITFFSYYENSSYLPIIRTDNKGNIYVVTSNPTGLTIRAFDEKKNLIWEKSIIPDQNTLTTILKDKGADHGKRIDISILGFGTRKVAYDNYI